MPTVTREATLTNAHGLHMRPAMAFVDLANQHTCDVKVRVNGEDDGTPFEREADGKSLMFVIQLMATAGSVFTITCDGEDAATAAEALATFVGELDEDEDQSPEEAAEQAARAATEGEA